MKLAASHSAAQLPLSFRLAQYVLGPPHQVGQLGQASACSVGVGRRPARKAVPLPGVSSPRAVRAS